MAKIRSYTTIEQSKVPAEILPIESADMYWDYDFQGQEYKYYPKVMDDQFDDVCTPCWSLAALLDVLPSRLFDSTPKRKELYLLPDLDKSYCFYRQFAVKTKGKLYLLTEGECLVDACVAMIIELHEQKLL